MFELVIGAMKYQDETVLGVREDANISSDDNAIDEGGDPSPLAPFPRGTSSSGRSVFAGAASFTNVSDFSSLRSFDGSIRIMAQGLNDAEGTREEYVTIPALQNILRNCGQELSADDVYNVIKDIDENGDGQLDQEEFTSLLEKLRILSEAL